MNTGEASLVAGDQHAIDAHPLGNLLK